MPPLDLPHEPRHLDEPWAEPDRRTERADAGAARPPGELLDQLWERLGRLAAGHPSAASREAEGDADGWPAAAADRSTGDADQPGDDQDRPTSDADRPPAPGPEPAYEPGTVLRSDGRRSDDPYLPWFMDAEPGVPWFAAGS